MSCLPAPAVERSAFVVDLLTEVGAHSKAVGLIQGPSGIGKTYTLRDIGSKSGAASVVEFAIGSSATEPIELYAKLASQLSEQGLLGPGTIRGFLNAVQKRPGMAIWKIAKAVIKDVIEENAPAVKSVMEEFSNIAEDADNDASTDMMAEKLTKANDDMYSTVFFDLIYAIGAQGKKICILIDNIDRASTPFLNAIIALIYMLPEGWSMFAAANDETSGAHQRIRQLGEVVCQEFGSVKVLPPLSYNDVLTMMDNYNFAGRLQSEIDLAIISCKGRALYINEWLSGQSLSEISLSISKRLLFSYKNRLQELPSSARELAIRLAYVPDCLPINVELISAIFDDIQNGNLIADISTLEAGGFVDIQNNSYKFLHENVRSQIRESANPAIRDVAIMKIEQVIGNFSLEQSSNIQFKLALMQLRRDRGAVIQMGEALGLAYDMLERGRCETAASLFEFVWEDGIMRQGGDQTVELLLGQAQAFIQMGRYSEGLAKLQDFDAYADRNPSARVRQNLARLEALVRLNRYRDAEKIARILHKSIIKEDVESEIELHRWMNVIQRDLGRYADAVLSARSALKLAQSKDVSKALIGRCYRTLSRSLALNGSSPEAIKAGENALDHAIPTGSARDVGNAYLALGEAYRHNGEYANAIESYKESIDYAKIVGNVDSLLWSTLGLADCYVLECRYDVARSSLSSIEKIVSSEQDIHPLEYMHWNLSKEVIEFISREDNHKYELSLRSAANLYSAIEISWPAEYVSKLIDGLPNEPKKF